MNLLVVESLLETAFKSNSYSGYRLTEKARAIVDGGEPALAEEAPSPLELPEDVFDDVLVPRT